MSKLISLEEFLDTSTKIFDIFGMRVVRTSPEPNLIQKLYGGISVVCLVMIVSQVMIFSYVHMGEEGCFLPITFDFSCIGIGVLTYLKVYMVCFNKHNVLLESIDMLDKFYPKTSHEQDKYRVKKHFDVLRLHSLSYKVLMPILSSVFSLSEILISIFKFLFISGFFERNLPYFVWFPFGFTGKGPIAFEVNYAIAVTAAFFCGLIVLAIDLLYCSLLTVLCMEFEMLKVKYEEFGCGDGKRGKADIKLLVAEHHHLIR